MKPVFIALGGSIGVGKTTLAYKLKEFLPDLVILEDDTIRRELLGFSLNHFMNHNLDNSFSEENHQKVRQVIRQRTIAALESGKPVIHCLTKKYTDEYTAVEQEYAGNANFKGIFLYAPEETIRQRLQKRKTERDTQEVLQVESGHASDADENVLAHLPINNTVPNGWLGINAALSGEQILQEAIHYINNKN